MEAAVFFDWAVLDLHSWMNASLSSSHFKYDRLFFFHIKNTQLLLKITWSLATENANCSFKFDLWNHCSECIYCWNPPFRKVLGRLYYYSISIQEASWWVFIMMHLYKSCIQLCKTRNKKENFPWIHSSHAGTTTDNCDHSNKMRPCNLSIVMRALYLM